VLAGSGVCYRRLPLLSRLRLLTFFTLLLSLNCASCVFVRIFYFNIPDLTAASYFDHRVVPASTHPVPFARRRPEAAFPMRAARGHTYATFDELLEDNDTRAFLVLHHGVIVYERYFGAITAETRLPAFSMSKTFAATLMGAAEQDGLIESAQQHLVDFLPSLSARPRYREITLDHLLRMTSGIDFEEESNAAAMLYYTVDLRFHTFRYDVRWQPGTHYQYGSINAQLLWEVLHRQLDERRSHRTVSGYFSEKLWEPLGAERSAEWALDSAENGIEKFAAGLSATARDYARLGVLFQHRGVFGGERVVSEQWVADSLADDEVAGVVHTTDGAVRRGRYQWFWTLDGRCYFAKGYRGQYVFVHKDRDVVVVRFGEGYGKVDWTTLFTQIAEGL
jgi:CubicO group peptidase (beta-lactamase class C family)